MWRMEAILRSLTWLLALIVLIFPIEAWAERKSGSLAPGDQNEIIDGVR
jgi:hypothetical protein